MADFKIQRGTAQITTTNASVTITASTDYDAPASATTAFIRITANNYTGDGGQGSDFSATDQVACVVSNPGNILTSITFSRTDAASNTIDIDWEIIEYIGTGGAANEFIVRGVENIAYASTTDTTEDSGTISGVVTDADVVVFITGASVTTAARGDSEELNSTAEWVGGATDVARITRTVASVVANVSVAVVEFTGSNWTVERITNSFAGTSAETNAITDVGSITRAFVHPQLRCDSAGDDAATQRAWITSTTNLNTQMSFFDTSADGVYWIISNSQTDGTPMDVQRISTTRAVGGGDPDSWNVTITAIDADLSISSMGAITNTPDTTQTDTPGISLIAKIASTTAVRFQKGRDVEARTIEAEVIEWPTVAAAGGTGAKNPFYPRNPLAGCIGV